MDRTEADTPPPQETAAATKTLGGNAPLLLNRVNGLPIAAPLSVSITKNTRIPGNNNHQHHNNRDDHNSSHHRPGTTGARPHRAE